MYCSILILQILNSPGLSIGTLDAATICADSESISSSKEILYIQTGTRYEVADTSVRGTVAVRGVSTRYCSDAAGPIRG
ncbi:hypothetical protein Tco_0670716 [Tanacetum coccineum]